MTYSMMVSIFFRLFNLALLIVFMRYVYKKYVYELLLQGVYDEHNALKSLEHEAHEAQQKRTIFDAQLHDDQELIIVLKKKISLWAAQEHKWRQKRSNDKESCRKELQAKADFKQIRITEYMIEREALPLIVTQAKKQLEVHYGNRMNSDTYIESIVNTLTKESSAHEYR